MPLSPPQRLIVHLTLKLWARALTLAVALTLTLTLAQLFKLSALLPWAALMSLEGEVGEALFTLLSAGGVVMWEGSAPLLALLSCALMYHRLALSRLPLAWQALGLHPAWLLCPALMLGCGLGGSALYTAHHLSPQALVRARAATQALAERALRDEPERLLSSLRAHHSAYQRGELRLQGESEGSHPLTHLSAEGRLTLWWPERERFAQVSGLTPQLDRSLTITGRGARLSERGVHAHVQTLTLSLESPITKALKSFGPPNATPTDLLGESPHERFTYHKRAALPLAALPWALLGALLGLWGRAIQSTLTASLSVAGAYSLLRALELRARFEGGDPMWAAWSPTLTLSLIALGWAWWWSLKR